MEILDEQVALITSRDQIRRLQALLDTVTTPDLKPLREGVYAVTLDTETRIRLGVEPTNATIKVFLADTRRIRSAWEPVCD